MRELILNEIRRLAASNDGKPPGVRAFQNATGITPAKWNGVLWARWGDAVIEAGFTPNTLQARSDSAAMLEKLVELTHELKRLPTRAEIKLRRRTDPSFPSAGSIANNYPTNDKLIAALRDWSSTTDDVKLASHLPDEAESTETVAVKSTPDGFVYLLKSGTHYKIGRSDDIERRFRQISIALPETTTLIHSIRTDDPPGIEVYWHRRFANKRANGEWFLLSPSDVRAFTRRTFQ